MINQENAVFQNIDEPNINPLNPQEKLKFKNYKLLFKDKKIILIFSLFIIFISLIIISLVFSQNQKPISSIIKLSQNPTPTQSLTQSLIINIPVPLQENFGKINTQINTQENFLPPEIDPNLGLK